MCAVGDGGTEDFSARGGGRVDRGPARKDSLENGGFFAGNPHQIVEELQVRLANVSDDPHLWRRQPHKRGYLPGVVCPHLDDGHTCRPVNSVEIPGDSEVVVGRASRL